MYNYTSRATRNCRRAFRKGSILCPSCTQYFLIKQSRNFGSAFALLSKSKDSIEGSEYQQGLGGCTRSFFI